MPALESIQDQLTTVLVLEPESRLTCQVLTPKPHGYPRDSQAEESTRHVASQREVLRAAESKVRQLGIPCFLGIGSLQLWTFCGPSNLSAQTLPNIVHEHDLIVLESATTTFSVDEILRNERSHVYDAFLCSMLAKLNQSISSTQQAIMLNPRTVIVYAPPDSKGSSSSRFLDSDIQYIGSIDLELVNGSIVLSIKHLKDIELQSVRKMLDAGVRSDHLVDLDAWLAPCGKPTRVQSISGVLDPESIRNDVSQQDATKRSLMKECVIAWLQKCGITPLEDDIWLDVNVVMPPETSADGSDSEGKKQNLQMLRSILWPSSLVFSNRQPRATEDTTKKAEIVRTSDPLKAAEDWFRGSSTRADKVGKRKAAKVAEQIQKDRLALEATVREENAGSSPTMIRAYPDATPSVAIYPTPPDGPLSHVTPGMSSIDGAVVTPGGTADVSKATSTEHQDGNIDMSDDVGNTGSGFFDDDLFEDNTGEKSESEEMDNDPDWDFFDEPGARTNEDAQEDDMKVDEPSGVEHSMDDATVSMKGQPSSHSEGLEQVHQHNESHDNVGSQERKETPVQNGLQNKPLEETDSSAALPTLQRPPSQGVDDGEPMTEIEPGHEAHQQSNEIKTASPDVLMKDAKYSTKGGRFWFGLRADPEISGQESINKTVLGAQSRMARANILTLEPVMQRSIDGDSSDGTASSSSSESTPFDSSEIFSEDEVTKDPWTTLKRKWTETAETSPPSPFLVDDDERKELKAECYSLLDHLFEDFGLYPMDTALYTRDSKEDMSIAGSAEDETQLAQLLVELASQSFVLQDLLRTSSNSNAEAFKTISRYLDPTPGGFHQVTFKQLSQVCGIDNDQSDDLVEFETPKIRVRRGDKDLEALPPILRFWETFGLQPASGSRSVTAFCMYPAINSMTENCEAFLSRIGQIYRNCNLGDHACGASGKLSNKGLISWPYNEDDHASDLLKLCRELGSELALSSPSSTIVLYVVHPFTTPESLVSVCRALLVLFKCYAKISQDQQKELPEIVFQSIPMSFIADEQALVIPSQADFLRLAIEVYNRCPPTNPLKDDAATASPAVLVANQVPKSIKFDLSSSNVSPIHTEGNVLHLAYSLSVDEHWATAAWTDNFGKKALTMSYCLRSKNAEISSTRPISTVIKDMWEISSDIIAGSPGPWHIIVSRESSISITEINAWVHQVNSQVSVSVPSSPRVSLTILTFDTEPPFQLSPPLSVSTHNRIANPIQNITHTLSTPTTANFPTSSSSQPPAMYGTPASTPTPTATQSVLSPEQVLTANTPGTLNAPTPTASVSMGGQSLSQQSHVPQSPAPVGVRTSQTQPQTPQSHPQSQVSGANATQAQNDIQAILESDPTAILESSSSRYYGILSPYPLSITRNLLDHHVALASAYLLQHSIEANATNHGVMAATCTTSFETIMSVNLVWTSTSDESPAASNPTSHAPSPSNKDTAKTPEKRETEGHSEPGSFPESKQFASSPADTSTSTKNKPSQDLNTASQSSLNPRHLLFHDILPRYRDLITLSETKGMGLPSSTLERQNLMKPDTRSPIASGFGSSSRTSHEKILPWHIMTVTRGRRMLELSRL